MNGNFIRKLLREHQHKSSCPHPSEVAEFFKNMLALLFSEFSVECIGTEVELILAIERNKVGLSELIVKNCIEQKFGIRQIVDGFFNRLPHVYDDLILDIDAIFEGDPAASSRREIIRSYPGFFAVAAYRLAHELHLMGVKDIPRIITEYAHSKTGVDIHPGAIIGKSFCIDHGTGIVIGETAAIGNHVKIYQGVTLGALSVRKKDANNKRHPTIKDHCVIYSGATILGGETIIGEGSIIGGNVWLTKSVPANSKIYYQAKMNVSGASDTDTFVFKGFAK